MPRRTTGATTRFSSSSLTITGGDKHYRFLQATLSGALLTVAARIFVEIFPMNELRSRVPRHTGRLARSLRLEQRGTAINLRGVFYSHFHERDIIPHFVELARETGPRAVRLALERARQ